jgi:hypothetical protein
MKTRILVVALACFSVGAVAQQSNGAQKPSAKAATAAAAPATGSQGAGAATEMKGNKTSQDSWDQGKTLRESPSKGSLGQTAPPAKQNASVTAGDVNGDGMPDKTAQPSSSGQNGASPSDVANGHPTGKRQHEPVSTIKSSEAAPNNK